MRPVLIESSGDSATPKYQVFCLTPSDGRDTTGRSMEVEAKWCPGQLQNHPKSPNSQCSNLEEAVMDMGGAEGCHWLLRDTHGFWQGFWHFSAPMIGLSPFCASRTRSDIDETRSELLYHRKRQAVNDSARSDSFSEKNDSRLTLSQSHFLSYDEFFRHWEKTQ